MNRLGAALLRWTDYWALTGTSATMTEIEDFAAQAFHAGWKAGVKWADQRWMNFPDKDRQYPLMLWPRALVKVQFDEWLDQENESVKRQP